MKYVRKFLLVFPKFRWKSFFSAVEKVALGVFGYAEINSDIEVNLVSEVIN